MMRSTSEILLDYQKLKERESENKLRALLIQAVGMISSSATMDVPDIDTSISGIATHSEIKNIGLSALLNDLSGLLRKIELFAKSPIDSQENYLRQVGLVNLIADAATLLGFDLKNLKNPDKHDILAHSLIQLTQFGSIAISVKDQALKYTRLLHSALDFSYWLELKLVKRRMLQEDLLVFGNLAKEFGLIIDITKIEPKGLDTLRGNLFNRSNLLVKRQLDPLSIKVYCERLVECVKKLEDVFIKTQMNTATVEEQHYFAKNINLLTFLMGSNQSFDERRVLAFVNHLEQEHALDLLRKRESLIMNRLIAQAEGQNEKTKRMIEKLLLPKNTLEIDLVEKINGYTPSLMHFVQDQTFSSSEKENAFYVNEQYKSAMNVQEEKERKNLIGKSLILIADGLLVAGVFTLSRLIGSDAVRPLMLNASILYVLGQKIYPIAGTDPVAGTFDFWSTLKIRSHMNKLISALEKTGKEHPLSVLFASKNNASMKDISEYEYEKEDYEEDWVHSEGLKETLKVHNQVENDYVLSDEELGLLLDRSPALPLIEGQ